MGDKFRSKMNEYAQEESKSMIFTEDLKNMVHLAESSPEDVELVLQMMQRYDLKVIIKYSYSVIRVKASRFFGREGGGGVLSSNAISWGSR